MRRIEAKNRSEQYEFIDSYIGEIYDTTETQMDDIKLLSKIIVNENIKILEPFCGNGRILLSLAKMGHSVFGIDLSEHMLNDLEKKITVLDINSQNRINFRRDDVILGDWPSDFDVIILGANCLYELATAEEQRICIEKASKSLRKGGYLYLDNNHMEGKLNLSWAKLGVKEKSGLSGICKDGTKIDYYRKAIWVDEENRLVKFRKSVEITTQDGSKIKKQWIQQKHPPSVKEMKRWITDCGFEIENLWGDRFQADYNEKSDRAIFWAKSTYDNN